MADKKSFLLYFDAYPLLVQLPPEQREHLLTAVYEYAMGNVIKFVLKTLNHF